MAAALRSERSTRSTPGRFSVAAQLGGTPLVSVANENTSTAPPAGSSILAGWRASSSVLPAPAVLMRARLRTSSVSSRPDLPKSRTWLFARAQASMRAAARQPTFSGSIR